MCFHIGSDHVHHLSTQSLIQFVLRIFSLITSNYFEILRLYQNLYSAHFEGKNSGDFKKWLSCLHNIHRVYTEFIMSARYSICDSTQHWLMDVFRDTRELKSLNVDIYFEAQNLNLLSSQGEFVLTLLGCS